MKGHPLHGGTRLKEDMRDRHPDGSLWSAGRQNQLGTGRHPGVRDRKMRRGRPAIE
jgi:hypothetical protein